MEIESLLVNVMQRTRQLKIETMILDDWNSDKNSETISKINSLSSPIPIEKQGTLVKKIKSFSGKPSTPLSKIKSAPVEEISAPIVRNDIPDTFWQSVEPYCADITEDDIKMLESQIEIQDNYMVSYKTIPPLGKHYSLQWAEEDIQQQVKEGSRLTEYEAKISTPAKKSAFENNQKYNVVNPLIDDTLTKIRKMPAFGKDVTKSQKSSESLTYGPLTQRLISALIEQNLMTPLDNEIGDYLDKIGPPQPMYMSPKTMAKKLHISNNNSNVSTLERKIKKTLIEQSILDDDEASKSANEEEDEESNAMQTSNSSGEGSAVGQKDDEIVSEIINLQNELKAVTRQCKQTLTNLVEISKHSLVKQDIRKKISLLDSEVNFFFQSLNNFY